MIRSAAHILHVMNRPCRENNLDISLELDHALPRATRIGLRLHMLTCGPCWRFRRQLRFLRAAAARMQDSVLARVRAASRMPADVRERLAQRLGQGR